MTVPPAPIYLLPQCAEDPDTPLKHTLRQHFVLNKRWQLNKCTIDALANEKEGQCFNHSSMAELAQAANVLSVVPSLPIVQVQLLHQPK